MVACHTIIELKLNFVQVLDAHIKHTNIFAFNIFDVEFEYLTILNWRRCNQKEYMMEYLKVSFKSFIKGKKNQKQKREKITLNFFTINVGIFNIQ